jgi:heat shock protein HtpX
VYHQIAHNKRISVVVVVLFVLVWLVVGVIVGQVGGSIVAGTVVFGVLALCGILYSYFFGGMTALALAGAKPADPTQYQELHHQVEALVIGAGLPKPAVYVIDDPSPNAFATGRDPQHASVAVTTGLLAMMNHEEMEGVLAHELSHVRNYDVRLLVILATLVGMAGLLGSLALQSAGRVRGRNSGQAALALLAFGLLLMVVGYLVGPLMQFALSRERESLADASGVELTRNPAGLLSALRKLAANDHPLQHWNHATAAMFIDDPQEHHQRHWFSHLYDTHPPIEERIAALEKIASVQQT